MRFALAGSPASYTEPRCVGIVGANLVFAPEYSPIHVTLSEV